MLKWLREGRKRRIADKIAILKHIINTIWASGYEMDDDLQSLVDTYRKLERKHNRL
jgi:methionine salvage enolase-phosphatase E1